jgi:ribosomal protein RSM22 (predicted rRNA methylase)
VRKTKHSGQGHEDTGYSYVVIRRGQRPTAPTHQVGRVGDIGKRELEKMAQKDKPMVELTVEEEYHSTISAPSSSSPSQSSAIENVSYTSDEVTEALRSEAYHWPRLVFPPLKKSGHIILDSCTGEGWSLGLDG